MPPKAALRAKHPSNELLGADSKRMGATQLDVLAISSGSRSIDISSHPASQADDQPFIFRQSKTLAQTDRRLTARLQSVNLPPVHSLSTAIWSSPVRPSRPRSPLLLRCLVLSGVHIRFHCLFCNPMTASLVLGLLLLYPRGSAPLQIHYR